LFRANVSVLFLGDSLTLHQYAHLRGHMGTLFPHCISGGIWSEHHKCIVRDNRFHDPRDPLPIPRTAFLAFQRSNKLPGTPDEWDKLLSDFKLSRKDIIVVGVGPWYSKNTVTMFEDVALMFTLARKNSLRWPAIFWREPLPQHFSKLGTYHGLLGRACQPHTHNATSPDVLLKVRLRETWSKKISEAPVELSRFHILRTFQPLLPRHDEHIPLYLMSEGDIDYSKSDCTHYRIQSSTHRFVASVTSAAIITYLSEVMTDNASTY